MSCLFCKIIEKEIPADTVFEDEHCLGFKDIAPQAPTHLLLIPKKHIATLNDLTEDDRQLVGHLMLQTPKLAKEAGVYESGYRTVFNCGQDANQTVFHIHLHILGGRNLAWPPG